VAQHLADALDNRQPETEAAHRARRLLQPLEFLEDEGALRLGYAGAGIADENRQPVAPPAHAEQDLARCRVFDGVGDKVLQQAAQQPPIRPHPGACGNDAQVEGLLPGQRRELHLEPLEHLV